MCKPLQHCTVCQSPDSFSHHYINLFGVLIWLFPHALQSRKAELELVSGTTGTLRDTANLFLFIAIKCVRTSFCIYAYVHVWGRCRVCKYCEVFTSGGSPVLIDSRICTCHKPGINQPGHKKIPIFISVSCHWICLYTQKSAACLEDPF